MNRFRVCFIGVGSIAKRHIKNLNIIFKERNQKLIIDAFRNSSTSLSEDLKESINHEFRSYEDLPDNYDVIFITNPTELHMATLEKVQYKAKNFFIEKPIVSSDKKNDTYSIEYSKNSVYYVAAPLRYNRVIQYIKNNIDVNKVLSIRCISSSFLPDWRPGIDYRNTYSAHKNLGGGVSIDLIHEWDYIKYLFGQPKKVLKLIGKKSKLEIDSEDCAIYIAEYEDKILELHLDYFGRDTIREIMLITEDETIIGDIANNKICFLKSGKVIDFKEERDDYQLREMNYFLELIEKKEKMNYIEEAYQTLNLTQGEI